MKRAVAGCPSVVVGVLMACAAASASEIGQQVADRINADTYRYYLDGRLYAHDGDDRDANCWYGFGPEHNLARDNIASILAGYGLSVELEAIDGSGQYYNVIATQLGTLYPGAYYVVGAHYDSAGTPGADDNGSGVAGVLEIARVLSVYQTEYTIKYIAFDREECGLYGSDAYVDAHVTDQILGMVSLDMIAWDGGCGACEIRGRTQSNEWKAGLADAVTTYGNGLLPVIGSGCDCSDHAPFEWAGYQACLLWELPGAADYCFANPCYHQDCDSVDTYVDGEFDQEPYIKYAYAADIVRSMAGFLADQAGAQALFDCATGAGCEPGPGNEDCNGNGVGDLCDTFCGTAADCNGNHVPDECDTDCNGNGVPDDCDLANGTSGDFNENGIPDDCEPHRTIYVDDDAPTDPGPGTPAISDPLEDGSPEHPFDSIQEGINAAISGDSVQVRNGVYNGIGNRDLDFAGRAITLHSETTPAACVIDCEYEGGGFYFHRGETPAALVSGFTIQHGECFDPQFYYYSAGGIRCYRASPTIENCRLISNRGRAFGDAVYCERGSPVFAGCYIAQHEGGDACFLSWWGGGCPVFIGCTFVGNTGWALNCSEAAATVCRDCVLAGNGAGIACSAGTLVVNCLVAGNEGPGVHCYGGGLIRNCTIAANGEEGLGCESGNPSVTSCIIWGNELANIALSGGNPDVTYSDIGGGWSGTGNIDADPLFFHPGQGDYHLRGDSPCIDAGDNNAVPQYIDTDLDGLPRFLDDPGKPDTGQGDPPIVDMGAYEYLWHDCNENSVADDLDIAAGTSQDCNANRVPDECDIASGTSVDCTGNGIPDECEPDCNANGIADSCDIAAGTSQDCSLNGIPDECEPDCNTNGVADSCDIVAGTSPDCTGDGIPDECELELSVLFPLDSDPGWSAPGQWAFGQPTGGGSHNHDPVAGHTGDFVYGYNLDGDYPSYAPALYLTSPPIDCTGISNVELRFWRWLGVQAAPYDRASIRVSYNGNYWITVWANPSVDIADAAWTQQTIDISWVADNQATVYIQWVMGPTDGTVTYPGWNIDDVEIHGTGDCNYNGIPDVCDSPEDCNGNGQLNVCDVISGWSADCNSNGIPDECDIANNTSTDVNHNLILDECESVGDLNCDGTVNFADINPFVLFLSNNARWLTEFPGCDPLNGDINGDGTYGDASFRDINPFVELLTHQ